MIGKRLFNILCEFYSAMLGLIWMLVDSLYHIIRPQKSLNENNKSKSTGECDLKNAVVGKSNDLNAKESLEGQQNVKSNLSFFCEKHSVDRLVVDPDINYLSKQKLIFAIQNDVLQERRLVLKRPHKYIYDVGLSSDTCFCNDEKTFSLKVIRNSPIKTNELQLKNNLIFLIREITEFMTKTTSADRREMVLKLSLRNPEMDLEAKKKKSNCSSILHSEPKIQSKSIKLDNDQILALQQTADYIINHLNVEVKADFKRKFEETELVNYMDINDDCSAVQLRQTKQNGDSNIIITELDSSDESEKATKPKSLRKKKNKKINRKNKFYNQKIEPNSATFSSKQCFERLALFMRANQGLTQSKMMLEIEKGFKPIKDQISELQDFVIVNLTSNEKFVKHSSLLVKPINNNGPKLRSILTVSSASLQKLALLADTSNNLQENYNLEITDSEPKKLSPMAEMYIKLSR